MFVFCNSITIFFLWDISRTISWWDFNYFALRTTDNLIVQFMLLSRKLHTYLESSVSFSYRRWFKPFWWFLNLVSLIPIYVLFYVLLGVMTSNEYKILEARHLPSNVHVFLFRQLHPGLAFLLSFNILFVVWWKNNFYVVTDL